MVWVNRVVKDGDLYAIARPAVRQSIISTNRQRERCCVVTRQNGLQTSACVLITATNDVTVNQSTLSTNLNVPRVGVVVDSVVVEAGRRQRVGGTNIGIV